MWRSSDGKMRIDTPATSVISDPHAQQTILLDHNTKQASILPMTPRTPGAAPPKLPQASAGAVQPPPMQAQDLGKSIIEGHEVEGKRFTFPPPPAMPQAKIPGAPISGAPPLPGVPSASAAPPAPVAPKPPTVAEVWTSAKLGVPVLTKVTGPAGEQTTYCKPTSTAEPHPSLFQIPPGYKVNPNP